MFAAAMRKPKIEAAWKSWMQPRREKQLPSLLTPDKHVHNHPLAAHVQRAPLVALLATLGRQSLATKTPARETRATTQAHSTAARQRHRRLQLSPSLSAR